jgi:hypothetical protein
MASRIVSKSMKNREIAKNRSLVVVRLPVKKKRRPDQPPPGN